MRCNWSASWSKFDSAAADSSRGGFSWLLSPVTLLIQMGCRWLEQWILSIWETQISHQCGLLQDNLDFLLSPTPCWPLTGPVLCLCVYCRSSLLLTFSWRDLIGGRYDHIQCVWVRLLRSFPPEHPSGSEADVCDWQESGGFRGISEKLRWSHLEPARKPAVSCVCVCMTALSLNR